MLLVMQVKKNYMCLVNVAASKKLKPIVAWMEFIDVCIPRKKILTGDTCGSHMHLAICVSHVSLITFTSFWFLWF